MNEYKTDKYQMLDNGLIVSKQLYDEIRTQVTDITPALLPDAEYTLKMLCEPGYWKSLSHQQRSHAGMSMTSMVRCNLVPYCFAGELCQSPKVYVVIR